MDGGNITIMSRRVYLIFGDIEDKLDVALMRIKISGSSSPSCLRFLPSPGSRNISMRGNASVPMTRAFRSASGKKQ